MTKLIVVFLILYTSVQLSAQPGFRVIRLNEASEYVFNTYSSVTHYSIDSTTDLSRFKIIKGIKSIRLHTYLNVLPMELSYLSDSLKEIWVDGNHRLDDLSALKTLKNLRSITIEFYNGEELPDLSGLKYLESVKIEDYYESNLISISGLSNCLNLKKLKIISGSLNKFDLDAGKMNLEELDLEYCDQLVDLTAINKFKNLKKLWLVLNKHLALIPDLPKEMPYLTDVFISDNDQLVIPGAFKKFNVKWHFGE